MKPLRPAVALDCRWLGIWGAGRVTQILLQGLAEDPPSAPWVLWGAPEALAPYAWPGAVVVPDGSDPREWRGQRAWFRIPEADVVLFAHQRPLRAVPAVTWIFDTISLRYGGSAVERRVRAAYLRRLGAISRKVLTISDHSRRAIERDLGVPADRIEVVTLPVDWAWADEVRRRRRPTPTAVFVGRDAPHKNLPRLVEAFGRTEFRAGGGRLVLIGPSAADFPQPYVDGRGRAGDDALADALAEATLLVQPSEEEGWGLPVAEALAAGVPVCVSDGGALPEAAGPEAGAMVAPFPARSVDAMAAAIDAAAAAASAGGPALSARLAGDARARLPTQAAFARRVRTILEAVR